MSHEVWKRSVANDCTALGYTEWLAAIGVECPVKRLVSDVLTAIAAYDATGDHQHQGGPYPGDCLRCALKPFEAAVREPDASASREA